MPSKRIGSALRETGREVPANTADARTGIMLAVLVGWMWFAMVIVATLGCGRVGFDHVDDGGSGGDGFSDATLGMFGTPTEIPGVSLPGYDDNAPDLTDDLLELYFGSDRPGGLGQDDIWLSTRPSTTAAWGPPVVVAELSSNVNEAHPTLCCGGLVMYIASPRPPAQGTDIFRSTRTALGGVWSTPVLVPSLASTGYDVGGTTTSDELEIIFDTNRASSVREIYRATRASTSVAWETPQRIEELVPTMLLNEGEARLATDNLLVFASARGPGYFDVWMSARASRADPFGAPQNVIEVNTPSEQRDPWLSPDGRVIVYAHETAAGDFDLYMATR
jgi:hypothetical protein